MEINAITWEFPHSKKIISTKPEFLRWEAKTDP